jgi:hypothetical protein
MTDLVTDAPPLVRVILVTIPGVAKGKQRGSPKKATDQQIRNAYAATGSVWKAASVLGMCGQSVHERMKRLGITLNNPPFSSAELDRLRGEHEAHADAGTLDLLAVSMGRPKTSLCLAAKRIGLTRKDRTREYLAEGLSVRLRAWHATHEHPRGMLGKPQSDKCRVAVSKASTARWEAMTPDERSLHTMNAQKAWRAGGNSARQRGESTWKGGWREIGGQRCYFRSRWEANYARYLQWLVERKQIVSWEHEPVTFWFEKIKRGTRSYLPDFRVTENGGAVIFHEVKGWMDSRSKTCIARMRIYHKAVKLIVIDKKRYRAIEVTVRMMIPGWESSK